jgi:hypothetical protein
LKSEGLAAKEARFTRKRASRLLLQPGLYSGRSVDKAQTNLTQHAQRPEIIRKQPV